MKKKKSIVLKFFSYIFVIGIGIILYSHFVGTKGLVIREYAIINEKIPESFNGFKIVHFTDLHYGTTIRNKEVKNIVSSINELNPDIVVFTGDLLDESYNLSEEEINELSELLNQIDPKIDKYIINGNHDIHKDYEKLLEKLDYIDLNNKNKLLYYNSNTPINIVGLADYFEHDMNIEQAFDYEYEEDYYTILLAHEPDVFDKLSEYNIDLVLSGHSHNGQVRIPFIGKVYTPVGARKYYDEEYIINNTKMFISGGLGTSTAPFRLFVKPSFNLYRLYTK